MVYQSCCSAANLFRNFTAAAQQLRRIPVRCSYLPLLKHHQPPAKNPHPPLPQGESLIWVGVLTKPWDKKTNFLSSSAPHRPVCLRPLGRWSPDRLPARPPDCLLHRPLGQPTAEVFGNPCSSPRANCQSLPCLRRNHPSQGTVRKDGRSLCGGLILSEQDVG